MPAPKVRRQPACPIALISRAFSIHASASTGLDGVEVKAGQNDHREQHDVAERRSLAGAEELKRETEDIDRHGFGRRAGTALGQEIDDVENLERLDGAKQQRQQQQAADVGKGDGPEPPPPPGPVDLGGLVEIFRHAHQAGEHQQHHERRPHPGVGDDDRDRRPRRGRQNDIGVGREQRDEPADEAERRVVEELEENPDRAQRQHHRRQDEHQEIAAQRKFLREQQRQQEADDQLQRDAADDDGRGIAGTAPRCRGR